MQSRTKRKHMIDFLFPTALFFVFALSALTVILIAARIYQSTTENSSLNYTSRTSLSYISEKVHQNDVDGGITLSSFDGCDALIIKQSVGEDTYYTYIYADDKELKELFIKEDVNADVSSGCKILDIEDFSLEQISDNLLKISCTDQNGQTASAIIGVRGT